MFTGGETPPPGVLGAVTGRALPRPFGENTPATLNS